MLKRINDKINFSFETEVGNTPEEIITLLRQKTKRQQWNSFLVPGEVDFKEFKFYLNKIEIRRGPFIFWPFRPFGKITLTLDEYGPARTKVHCEILPGHNWGPLLIMLQTGAILLWSFFWILSAWRLDPLQRFGVPVGILIVATAIFLIKLMNDRRRFD